jgi:DNA ligase (NAD+)
MSYLIFFKLKLEQLINLDRMAEKSSRNLLDAIEKSKSTSLPRFIYALGIRNVGESTAKDLAGFYGDLDEIMKQTEESFTDCSRHWPYSCKINQ